MQPKSMRKGNVQLLERARDMRNNATTQENRLWYLFLKHQPEQWYRQRIVGNYIVDFYCPKAMFVIELDGMHHCTSAQKIYDKERDAYLTGLGLVVERFFNSEIDENFPKVCKQITTITNKRQQAPKLLREEGAPAVGG